MEHIWVYRRQRIVRRRGPACTLCNTFPCRVHHSVICNNSKQTGAYPVSICVMLSTFLQGTNSLPLRRNYQRFAHVYFTNMFDTYFLVFYVLFVHAYSNWEYWKGSYACCEYILPSVTRCYPVYSIHLGINMHAITRIPNVIPSKLYTWCITYPRCITFPEKRNVTGMISFPA